MNGRISGDEVSPDDVSLNSRDEIDPVHISGNRVVLYQIASTGRRDQTDTEVDTRGQVVAIAADPVRTEPVVAGATGQSYASARIHGMSIADGDVALQQVVRPTSHIKAGPTVGGHGHARHGNAGRVADQDALIAESLDDTKSPNHDIFQRVDQDTRFPWTLGASAAR